MDTEKRTSRYIRELEAAYPWLKNVLVDLTACYAAHGLPDQPGGASTTIGGNFVTLANKESLWDNATDRDVAMHNDAIEALYEIVGYVYIGSGQWNNQYESDDNWDDYQNEAHEIVGAYILLYFWDDFCAASC